MKCPKCGHANDLDAAFCEKCGTPLKEQSGGFSQTTKILLVVVVILVAIVGVSAGILLKDSQTENQNNTQISEVTGFPVSEVSNLAGEILENNGVINSVNYGSVTLDQNQCIYILSRAIVMIDQGQEGNIPIKSFGEAPNPYGYITTGSVTRSQYVDIASRMYTWMDNNGQTPNFIGIYTSGQPDLSPTTALNLFSKVLAEYKSTGQLPASVDI